MTQIAFEKLLMVTLSTSQKISKYGVEHTIYLLHIVEKYKSLMQFIILISGVIKLKKRDAHAHERSS